jgi:hypothetical protein
MSLSISYTRLSLNMSDNNDTTDDPLEHLPKSESANSADQNKTNISSPEKENMEVHPHTHHSEKKNWQTYLWEFLMLFLAVFCGFLAEYQLEHVIEHNRERQFVESYIEDLKTDTASIRVNIAFRENKQEKMDSLMSLLETHQLKGHENQLYFFGRHVVRTKYFQSNDRTIIQLKNSGSLRLIRNETAADSMISYQKLVEILSNNQADERLERLNSYPLLSKMFNPFVFDKMVTTEGISRPVNNPPLRSYDVNLQEDLAFNVHMLNGSAYLIISRLRLLNVKAINTINLLKREYHLE